MRYIYIYLVLASVASAQSPYVIDDLAEQVEKIDEDYPMKDRIAKTEPVASNKVVTTSQGPIEIRASQHKPSWRCVHNGVNLITDPFFSDGETWTIHKIIEAPTIEALDIVIEGAELKEKPSG